MANLHSGHAAGFKLFGKLIQPDAHPHHHHDGDAYADAASGEDAAAALPPPPPTPPPQAPSGLAEPAAALRCPRCGSGDTKFCYYNNHNVRQPRHLCRACRRYWTAGGALRRVASAAGERRRARAHHHAAAAARAAEGEVGGMETLR